MKLRVWAPYAERLEALFDGTRLPLEAVGDGYFEADCAHLAASADYFLSVDGGPNTPDPRSRFQPAGVHGPSRWVDPATFSWTAPAFCAPPLDQAVIYELHVGTFTEEGTFESALSRLDHLLALGVTHVELMPVCEFSGSRGWGYDGVNLFAPHHAYGGPLGLQRFVDGCHARGLAVLLDVVYNHLGPSGNYLPRFGPYFEAASTPWGAAVNLASADSAPVRRFFIDNALMWLHDYHIDGLRLDAVQAFRDPSAYPFLEQLAHEVAVAAARSDKRWVLIAECDRADPRTTRSLADGGLGMDAQWSDDFVFALHAVFTGERNGRYRDFGSIERLAQVLRHGFAHRGDFSAFWRRPQGHPRALPRPLGLIGYLQTHDQVGNRPRGERFGHLVGRLALRQASALTLLGPFVPMLFQGEEWAASTPFLYFTNHEDEALGEQVKLGREREFRELGFEAAGMEAPQTLAAFARSRLDWSELEHAEHREVLSWYQALLRLRSAEPALREAKAVVDFSETERWLTLQRGPFLLLLNLSEEPTRIPLRQPASTVLESGVVALASSSVELSSGALALLKHVD